MKLGQPSYSRVWNKHNPTFINFWNSYGGLSLSRHARRAVGTPASRKLNSFILNLMNSANRGALNEK